MRSALILLAASLAAAQEPAKPELENTGDPMRVPFQCTADDMHSFGLTCPYEQPCPVYLDLSGLDAAGNRIFVSGNLHTETTTLSSILLASEDEGKTWTEPYERIRGAGLDQIQFFDLVTGWIGGETLTSVPHDPFFLLTSDGGKSWRRRSLWSDARAGAIDLFRFDSKTHGVLYIDRSQAGEGNRYESYESMTGGESWTLSEGGNRPPIKKPTRPAPQTWRLQPDPKTHSFRIERQSGERWQAVASFMVHAGECREPEPQLAPEPPSAVPPQP